MVKDELGNGSDWDDTLPDLPECDLWGAAVILEFKEKRHLILKWIWFLHLMIGSYNNSLGSLFDLLLNPKLPYWKIILEYMIEYTAHSAIFTIQNI